MKNIKSKNLLITGIIVYILAILLGGSTTVVGDAGKIIAIAVLLAALLKWQREKANKEKK